MSFLFPLRNRGNQLAKIGSLPTARWHNPPKTGHRSDSKRLRAGLTLVEVLLVLALMVVFGALAWPALRYPLANQRLRAAAEQIRVEWTRARLEAIKTQTPYIFRFLPGENRYTVEPLGSSSFGATGAQAGWDVTFPREDTWGSGFSSYPQEKTVPEGIIFVGGTAEGDTRADAVVEELAAVLGPAVFTWSDPIIFFPDGTATDAEVTLQNDQGRQITVWLRGLTGIAQVGQIARVENSTLWGYQVP
jgi:type II secretory pathway pseudopilin PulG